MDRILILILIHIHYRFHLFLFPHFKEFPTLIRFFQVHLN